MQGIDHLDFRPDKFGNQDIVGMVSAQEEVVSFSNIIYPVDAKGMVEKWLLQVEKQMIKSLRDTIEKAMSSYYSTPLTNWVLDWAGQVGNIVLWEQGRTQTWTGASHNYTNFIRYMQCNVWRIVSL